MLCIGTLLSLHISDFTVLSSRLNLDRVRYADSCLSHVDLKAVTSTVAGPTVTSTITISSGGVSPGAVGRIAAGIVGGFLLLGALVLFWVSRNWTPAPIGTSQLEPRISQGIETKGSQGVVELGARLSSVG